MNIPAKRLKTESESHLFQQMKNDYPILQLRGINKSYRSGKETITVIQNCNMEINRGEFVGIIGKSGSGKSTLLNIITGVDRPDDGAVAIKDVNINTLSDRKLTKWRGRNIGIVFQFFQLIPTLTLLENVMLPMDFCKVHKKRERRSIALSLLEKVDLSSHASSYPAQTSGGQQQRTAIARSLANDPSLIIADEPTGNLDAKTSDKVFSYFDQLRDEGKTIVLVTHDSSRVKQMDRYITISDGIVYG